MGVATSMLILGAASLGMQAWGQWRAGKAEKEAGESQQRAAEKQADLSEYNAEVATVQAKDAVVRGDIEANRFRSRARVLIGEQRAGMAAGNVDVGYGSAVDVQADAAFLGELDALTVRTNAAKEAWGYRVEAEDQRTQADIQREEGVNLAAAGRQRQSAQRWQAIGTIASGSYSLLDSRYGFGRRG